MNALVEKLLKKPEAIMGPIDPIQNFFFKGNVRDPILLSHNIEQLKDA
jgi:hypothetical protein